MVCPNKSNAKIIFRHNPKQKKNLRSLQLSGGSFAMFDKYSMLNYLLVCLYISLLIGRWQRISVGIFRRLWRLVASLSLLKIGRWQRISVSIFWRLWWLVAVLSLLPVRRRQGISISILWGFRDLLSGMLCGIACLMYSRSVSICGCKCGDGADHHDADSTGQKKFLVHSINLFSVSMVHSL